VTGTGDGAQQGDLHDRHRDAGVQDEQSATAGRGGQRQHDRGPDQREPVSSQVDQQRYE
jgi:hypothetical protein